jgi:PAS domain-containing protein
MGRAHPWQVELAELDDVIVRCKRPYPPYGRFEIWLARLRRDGRFELLSNAWEARLGFTTSELDGRSLFTLLPLEPRAGRSLLRRMLDPVEPDPLDLELLRRDGGTQALRCYRRFDEYERALFIAGEALALRSGKYRSP